MRRCLIVVGLCCSAVASTEAHSVFLGAPSGGHGNASIISPFSTEVLAPIAETVLLGTAETGDLASWAADDDNTRRICQFFVPLARSPYLRIDLKYTTTKPKPTAIAFNLQVSAKTGGTHQLTIFMQDKTNNAYFQVFKGNVGNTLPFTATGIPTGDLSKYVGTGGAMNARIEMIMVGLQAARLPCDTFGFGQMVVTD